MLKPTNSRDGKFRASLQIRYRIDRGIVEGALQFEAVNVRSDHFDQWLAGLSRTSVDKTVRAMIYERGIPALDWGDETFMSQSPELVEAIAERVTELFPEFGGREGG